MEVMEDDEDVVVLVERVVRVAEDEVLIVGAAEEVEVDELAVAPVLELRVDEMELLVFVEGTELLVVVAEIVLLLLVEETVVLPILIEELESLSFAVDEATELLLLLLLDRKVVDKETTELVMDGSDTTLAPKTPL